MNNSLSRIVSFFIKGFSDPFNLVFLAVMAAVVFCYVFKFHNKIKVVISEIKNTISNLEDLNLSNASEKYEDVKEIFERNDYLRTFWLGYKKSHFFMKDHNNKTLVYTTADADDYFNFNNITSGYNIAFWQNLGGIFTGLGILGTFFGLSMGLSTIDLEHITNKEIGNLVSGMSTAFFTSLLGIIFALSYNYFYKSLTDTLLNIIQMLNTKLENIFVPRSAEQLLADSYAQSIEQSNQFKSFSDKLAVSIGDALEQKLSSSSFAENIKDMDSTLAQVNSFMSEELPSVISDAIGEQIKENLVPFFVSLQNAIETLSSSGQSAIADGIKSGASKELTAFADTLQQMNTNLQAVMAQMQETSGSVNSDLTSAINRVVDRLESQGENLQGVGNQVAKDLQDTVAALVNEMGKQQSGMINTSEKINDDLKASISTMVESIQISIASMVEETKKQQGNMQNSANSITSNLEAKVSAMLAGFEKQLAAIEQQTHNQSNALSATSTQLSNSFAGSMNSVKMDIKGIMDDYAAKNKAENEETINFIRQVKAGLAEQQSVLAKITTQVDMLMTRAANTADKFTQAAGPINDAGKELGKNMDAVLNATNNYNQVVKQCVTELHATAQQNTSNMRDISQEIARVKEALAKAADQYTGVNNELDRILDTVNKNLSSYNNSIKEQYADSLEIYSKQLSAAYGQLVSLIEELQDSIDNIKG